MVKVREHGRANDRDAIRCCLHNLQLTLALVKVVVLKRCKYEVKVLVNLTIFPHACAFHNLGFWNQFDDVVPMLTRSVTHNVELHIHSVDVISDELQILLVCDSSNPSNLDRLILLLNLRPLVVC